MGAASPNASASVCRPTRPARIARCWERVRTFARSATPASLHGILAACTFLGPSRKRGPPKGYIDALEARMHQAEALLGVLIGSGDERALTLFADLAHVSNRALLTACKMLMYHQDSLAAEIIARVDGSPYGATGRRRGAELPTKRQSSRTSPAHEPPPPGATQFVVFSMRSCFVAKPSTQPDHRMARPSDRAPSARLSFPGTRPSHTRRPRPRSASCLG
jgi:hypothetical protein